MNIRSVDGTIIETVCRENGEDPLVLAFTLSGRGTGKNWRCVVTLMGENGPCTGSAKVKSLELEVELGTDLQLQLTKGRTL